jgi:xanthine/uracil permease
MQPIKDERSLGQILKELTGETSTLLRQEVELAKTEMSEKASRLGTNVGAMAVGGAVTFLGALALLFALIYGLTSLLDQFMSLRVAVWLAPLVVGLVLATVGYTMIKKARETLRHEGIAPKRTTESLQENKEWLKAKMQ